MKTVDFACKRFFFSKYHVLITFISFFIITSLGFITDSDIKPQKDPGDWWIPLIKKHNLDITKLDFKRFYKFGNLDFGFNNALVIGDAPVVTPAIANFALTKPILILRISQNEYYLIKASNCDIQFQYDVITYYKGIFESFTFDDTKSTRSFSFKRLQINIRTNKIEAKTDSGRITI